MSTPSGKVHSSNVKEVKKFSDFLGSDVFTVVVGEGDQTRSFKLHQDLLVNESERFAKSVLGDFREAHDREITLEDEDPNLFGYFVEFMYVAKWGRNEKVRKDVEYVVLARLYTLGDRLLAPRFQKIVFQKFIDTFPYSAEDMAELNSYQHYLPAHHVCELLEIVLNELPEDRENDPLRTKIFDITRTRMDHLTDHPHFVRLCEGHPNLREVVRNDCSALPSTINRRALLRFKPESVFPASTIQVDFSRDSLHT